MRGKVGERWHVHLFAGPYVTIGDQRVRVPKGSERLLAFVALSGGRVERSFAAGSLWPYGDDSHATANLRSALWRLRRAGIDVIEADKWSVTLADGVDVDVRLAEGWATRLIHRSAQLSDMTLEIPSRWSEMLPGWYDDWVVIERERNRQRMLHALESLTRELIVMNLYAEAITAAALAVESEPLRESAQRALIDAYLAAGDRPSAERVLARYTVFVTAELGVAPSRDLVAAVRPGLMQRSNRRVSAVSRHGPVVVHRMRDRVASSTA